MIVEAGGSQGGKNDHRTVRFGSKYQGLLQSCIKEKGVGSGSLWDGKVGVSQLTKVRIEGGKEQQRLKCWPGAPRIHLGAVAHLARLG